MATITSKLKLEEEYRLIRAALLKAGVNMNDSIDALYRVWLRRRETSKSLAANDNGVAANADQWWAGHLAQFRSLIDPRHVAARAERTRKDRIEDRPNSHPSARVGGLSPAVRKA